MHGTDPDRSYGLVIADETVVTEVPAEPDAELTGTTESLIRLFAGRGGSVAVRRIFPGY